MKDCGMFKMNFTFPITQQWLQLQRKIPSANWEWPVCVKRIYKYGRWEGNGYQYWLLEAQCRAASQLTGCCQVERQIGFCFPLLVQCAHCLAAASCFCGAS